MKVASFFTLLSFCGLLSCSKLLKEADCPSDIVCTAVFAQINLSILDENGKNVTPSRTETRSLDGSFQVSREVTGQHDIVVADDGDLKKLSKDGTQLIFKAFINIYGQEVPILEQAFIIGHDCCHVIRISGPEQVVLDCRQLSKCEMTDNSGPCNAAIPKVFFDKSSKKCKTFIWGGCGPYPFDTVEQCEKCGCN